VPLFLDRLSWSQVSELLFRWSFSGGNVSIARQLPRVLANIRSLHDIKRYAVMARVYIRLKIKRLLRRQPA